MFYGMFTAIELVYMYGGVIIEQVDQIVRSVYFLKLQLQLVAVGGSYCEVVSKWDQRLVWLHEKEVLIA